MRQNLIHETVAQIKSEFGAISSVEPTLSVTISGRQYYDRGLSLINAWTPISALALASENNDKDDANDRKYFTKLLNLVKVSKRADPSTIIDSLACLLSSSEKGDRQNFRFLMRDCDIPDGFIAGTEVSLQVVSNLLSQERQFDALNLLYKSPFLGTILRPSTSVLSSNLFVDATDARLIAGYNESQSTAILSR